MGDFKYQQKVLPLLTPYNRDKLRNNVLPLHQVRVGGCVTVMTVAFNSFEDLHVPGHKQARFFCMHTGL